MSFLDMLTNCGGPFLCSVSSWNPPLGSWIIQETTVRSFLLALVILLLSVAMFWSEVGLIGRHYPVDEGGTAARFYISNTSVF